MVAEKSLAQKRSEIIAWYKENGTGELSDKKFLELLLCMSCDNCDYKKATQNLLNKFQNLENIFNSDVSLLLKVDGVTESMAVFLSLFMKFETRINENHNIKITKFNDTQSMIDFAKNMLITLPKENILIVSMDKNKKMIDKHLIEGNGVNFASVSAMEISKIVVVDKPRYVFVAHNHPKGFAYPSSEDVNFTINLHHWLGKMGVKLLDHIIVANEGTISFVNSEEFKGLI